MASKPKILVTGGCGYIGSHTVVELLLSGYDVVSVDNGINSSFDILNGIEAITGMKVHNINVDLSNTEDALRAILPFGPFEGIIHFAALKRVDESVRRPLLYFQNNINSSLTVLQLMEDGNIPFLIFSSSCTVYGKPERLPVTEETPMARAENPYGATKQTGEILFDQYFSGQSHRAAISLRYFNPAGAHPSALIGEASSQKATNLVPIIMETAIGLRPKMYVHGDDYATRDGSCIRDFIHVTDLAKAHILAMDYLMRNENKDRYEVFNLGMGEGVTVLEAIQAFEDVTGKSLHYEIGPRRPGDVPAIYADNSRIAKALHWKPESDIQSIMRTAWVWELKRHTTSA